MLTRRTWQAFALPMKLKYDCPAPSKYGSDDPLWKTATVSFLHIVRQLLPALSKTKSGIARAFRVSLRDSH